MTLAQVLCHLPKEEDSKLLVGLETSDDAAVYQIDENTGLIQTVDFFTPIVDDPYLFGQIAAANALSDIYAMGGKPLMALNLVAFPSCSLSLDVLAEILKGGGEKVREAGAVLAGGHTIEDNEPKYGLAVSGLVEPQKIWTNSGAEPGDLLILTKPLGTGIISTALKAEMADDEAVSAATRSMAELNKAAAEAGHKVTVHGCTDITGFGFLGHSMEMAKASKVTIAVYMDKIPLLPLVTDYAAIGLIPAGAYQNMDYLKEQVFIAEEVAVAKRDILFDPQTSGGLLLSLPPEQAKEYLKYFPQACVVGEVREQEDFCLKVF